MIFYILLALAAVITVGVTIRARLNNDDPILTFCISLILSAAVGAVTLGLTAWLAPSARYELKKENTYSLASLDTGSGTEGRSYFLGGGYLNGFRVLNYIRSSGEGYVVKSVTADTSLIIEDEAEPSVIVRDWEQKREWLVPWVEETETTQEFHIPKGSILSDFTLDNSDS